MSPKSIWINVNENYTISNIIGKAGMKLKYIFMTGTAKKESKNNIIFSFWYKIYLKLRRQTK